MHDHIVARSRLPNSDVVLMMSVLLPPVMLLHIIDAYSDFFVSLPCNLLVYNLDMAP